MIVAKQFPSSLNLVKKFDISLQLSSPPVLFLATTTTIPLIIFPVFIAKPKSLVLTVSLASLFPIGTTSEPVTVNPYK